MGLSYRLVFIAGIAVALTVGQQLEVYPKDEKVVLREGENKVLTCQVTGVADEYNPNLKWRDGQDKEITQTDGDVHVERDADGKSVQLYISNGIEGYAGVYTCEGVLDGKPAQQAKEIVFVQPIKFVDAPSPQYPVINTDALIICNVSGNPAPEVSWLHNNAKIRIEGRHHYEPKHSKGLKISKITQADDGVYTCRATVAIDGQMAQRKIKVEVHIPPTITQEPPEETLGTEGQNKTEFSCKADGFPAPSWEFFKGDSDVALTSSDRVQVDGSAGTISFKPLKKEDEGTYYCEAKNDAGSKRAQGVIKVHVMPGLVELKDQTAGQGEEGVLECKVLASPPAAMTFTKVGSETAYVEGPQPEDDRITIEKEDNILRLRITELKPEDTASYTCGATNSAGSNQWTGTVTVEFKPNLNDTTVSEVYNWAGKTRNLTCVAQAMPQPEWEWTHNGQKITANNTFKIYSEGLRSSLAVTVKDIEEGFIYGDYQCSATNGKGSASHSINMKQATEPGAPESIYVVNGTDTPTTIPISVRKPRVDGGVKVIGYRLEYNQTTRNVDLEDVDQEVDLIKVENLKASTEYFFSVRARNAVGLGNAAQLVHTTPTIRKPYPIEIDSDTESSSPNEFVAKWKKPLTGGMKIQRYIFRYRKMHKDKDAPMNDWSEKQVTDDQSKPMMSYTLKDLEAYTRYQLVVLAKNTIGMSEEQEPFYFFTAQAEPGDKAASVQKAGISTGAIIGIVIAVVIIFIIIIDVSCYFMNDCGLFMCIRVHVCGKQKQGHEKVMEEGEGEALKPASGQEEEADKDADQHEEEHDEKKPLTEDTKADEADDVKKPPEGDVEVVDPSDADVAEKNKIADSTAPDSKPTAV